MSVHFVYPTYRLSLLFFYVTGLSSDDIIEQHIEENTDYPVTSYDKVNNLDGVSFEIKEGSLSNSGLILIIKNKNTYECTFGSFYCLEKKIGENWYQLPYVTDDNVGWHSIGYPVGANGLNKEFLELETTWEWRYSKLDSGE